MHFLQVLFLATLTSAAAVPEAVALQALPAQTGGAVRRAEAESGPFTLEGLTPGSNIVVSVAVVTPAPEPANAMRIPTADDPDSESSSSCKPSSVCFDGITCGLRYGGCFDKNFCAGSTSFPAPTCTDDLSAGLSQNMQKRAEAAAAARVA